jgi:hypothetical protein
LYSLVKVLCVTPTQRERERESDRQTDKIETISSYRTSHNWSTVTSAEAGNLAVDEEIL